MIKTDCVKKGQKSINASVRIQFGNDVRISAWKPVWSLVRPSVGSIKTSLMGPEFNPVWAKIKASVEKK